MPHNRNNGNKFSKAKFSADAIENTNNESIESGKNIIVTPAVALMPFVAANVAGARISNISKRRLILSKYIIFKL